MVKSVLAVHHAGLRDWVVQRLSAVYLALYTFILCAFFISHPVLSFEQWHRFLSHTSMKIATLLCLLSLLAHAWVGMWTILTDYVKSTVLRLILQVLILFMLMICLLWGFLIMGSI